MCYDIPVEMRMNHNLYKKWIIKKYPKAADFKWEKIDDKITSPEILIQLRVCQRESRVRSKNHGHESGR